MTRVLEVDIEFGDEGPWEIHGCRPTGVLRAPFYNLMEALSRRVVEVETQGRTMDGTRRQINKLTVFSCDWEYGILDC